MECPNIAVFEERCQHTHSHFSRESLLRWSFSPPLSLTVLMTLTSVSGVDPDPTTQIPWPGARKRSDREVDAPQSTPANGASRYSSRRPSVVSRAEMNAKRRLSTLDLFNLSISMAGAQIAWTVELG